MRQSVVLAICQKRKLKNVRGYVSCRLVNEIGCVASSQWTTMCLVKMIQVKILSRSLHLQKRIEEIYENDDNKSGCLKIK